jgi:hypothetical protein
MNTVLRTKKYRNSRPIRDHRVARRGEFRADPFRALVVQRLRRRPRGPEDGHRRAELGQQAEALDELRLDPQHPPRVGMHPVAGTAPVQQSLVRGGLRDVLAAQRRWPLTAQPTSRL